VQAGKLNYAASGGYVAFSADTTMLEEFLRGNGAAANSLRDKPGLACAMQAIGGAGTGWFGYENRNETMRLWFEKLRLAPAPAADSNPLFPLTDSIPFARPEASIRAWMDFSLLPPFDKVAKYFSYTVSSGSATADGLTFKLFAPVPPQLKK
jgi:hypothetical protein